MQVEIVAPSRVQGKHYGIGQVLEVPEQIGLELIAATKAVRHGDGITPLTPEQQAEQEAQTAKEGYVKRNLIALDMEGAALLGDKNDETISSWLARGAEEHHVVGEIGSKILDVFQRDHGAKAQAGDVERAVEVEKIEESSPGLEK